MIAQRLGIAFEDLAEVADDRPGKDHAYQLDSTKAGSILNMTRFQKLTTTMKPSGSNRNTAMKRTGRSRKPCRVQFCNRLLPPPMVGIRPT